MLYLAIALMLVSIRLVCLGCEVKEGTKWTE